MQANFCHIVIQRLDFFSLSRHNHSQQPFTGIRQCVTSADAVLEIQAFRSVLKAFEQSRFYRKHRPRDETITFVRQSELFNQPFSTSASPRIPAAKLVDNDFSVRNHACFVGSQPSRRSFPVFTRFERQQQAFAPSVAR